MGKATVTQDRRTEESPGGQNLGEQRVWFRLEGVSAETGPHICGSLLRAEGNGRTSTVPFCGLWEPSSGGMEPHRTDPRSTDAGGSEDDCILHSR